MKEYYFPHDVSATSDPKIIELITRVGLAGLAMYWIIVEILHKQENGQISEIQFNSYIKFYGSNQNTMENFSDIVKDIFFEIGLFEKKDGKIYSKRVDKNIEEMKAKSFKAKSNAEKRRTNAETTKEEMPKQCERNANAMLGNEMKGNKIKEKEINIKKEVEEKRKFLDFVLLSQTEHVKLIEMFGDYNTKKLIDTLNNYIGSKGVKYKSHYYTILNWARRDGIQKAKAKEIVVEKDKVEMTPEQIEANRKKLQEIRQGFLNKNVL